MSTLFTDKAAIVRRKAPLSEFAFGIVTLLLTALVVHSTYTLVIRPRAVQRDRALLELPFMESNEG